MQELLWVGILIAGYAIIWGIFYWFGRHSKPTQGSPMMQYQNDQDARDKNVFNS